MLVLVLSALAAAAPLSDDVPFQEGLRLFEEFEYERAIFRFKEAERVEGRSDEDRAVVLAWLGYTYAELGDEASATENFTLALRLDPRVALPAEASPKAQQLFQTAETQAQAPPPTATPGAASPAPGPSSTTPAPTQAPSTTEPLATEVMGGPQPEQSPDANGPGLGLPLLIGGASVAGLGVLSAGAAGLVAFLAFNDNVAANGATFQSERAALNEDSELKQQVASGLLIASAAALVVGGGVAGASFFMGGE